MNLQKGSLTLNERIMNYSKIFSLDSKIAVITGGCGYLGREIVKGFAINGASVYVLDYTIDNKIELEDKDIENHIQYLQCDLNNTESIKQCLRKLPNKQVLLIVLSPWQLILAPVL